MTIRGPRALTVLTLLCLGLALMAGLIVVHQVTHPASAAQEVPLGWLVVGEAAAIAAVALLLLGREREGRAVRAPSSPPG